jgi:molybdopterin molybdotransferase
VLSVADARTIMLAAIEPLATETVALAEAYERTLATPLMARRDQPPFSPSAMDGYALRAADTPGALRIVGESAAGRAFTRRLGPGEAVRISTGAPIPDGADAVLIQEDASIDGDRLAAPSVAAGRHVRPRGGDYREGAVLLEAGRRLDAAAITLAASTGAAELTVARSPRVAILCGGDEIVAPGARPRDDQIFESCSFGIEALGRRWGAIVTRHPPLADDPAAIERAARDAIEHSDLVVFIGSASVGPHDHARPAFLTLGARILVPKVDMRPGKPTWFASTPRAPVLGLPGNPASALVAAALFLGPILAKSQGRSADAAIHSAVITHALAPNGPREAYLRARVDQDGQGRLVIDAAMDQDSSLMSVFARSNALLRRPGGAPEAKPGDAVCFLNWPD